MTAYHQPVLLDEAIEGLNIQASGTYVDATFGGGGHSREILRRLGKTGSFMHLTRMKMQRHRFRMINGSFLPGEISGSLKITSSYYGVKEVDGILADLGVSSHHFDTPGRGFSYRFDSALDMRMNSKEHADCGKNNCGISRTGPGADF